MISASWDSPQKHGGPSWNATRAASSRDLSAANAAAPYNATTYYPLVNDPTWMMMLLTACLSANGTTQPWSLSVGSSPGTVGVLTVIGPARRG